MSEVTTSQVTIMVPDDCSYARYIVGPANYRRESEADEKTSHLHRYTIRNSMAEHSDPTIPPVLRPHEWLGITDKFGLTERQSQVLGLVIQSHNDDEIVKMLKISKSTVRTHLKETKNRLSAKGRVGLAYRVLVAFREVVEGNKAGLPAGETPMR